MKINATYGLCRSIYSWGAIGRKAAAAILNFLGELRKVSVTQSSDFGSLSKRDRLLWFRHPNKLARQIASSSGKSDSQCGLAGRGTHCPSTHDPY